MASKSLSLLTAVDHILTVLAVAFSVCFSFQSGPNLYRGLQCLDSNVIATADQIRVIVAATVG